MLIGAHCRNKLDIFPCKIVLGYEIVSKDLGIIKGEWCVKCVGIKKQNGCQEKKQDKQIVPEDIFCAEHEIDCISVIKDSGRERNGCYKKRTACLYKTI